MLFLMILPTITYAISPIVVSDSSQEYSIGDKVGIFIEQKEKPQSIQSIQNIQFEVDGEKIIHLSNGKGTMWIKIPLSNQSDFENWFLEIGSGLADVEAYIPTGKGYEQIKLGFSLPYEQRFIKTDRILIPLGFLKAHSEQTLFIKLNSDYFQAPLHVASLKHFMERDHRVDIAEGLYYGFIIVMLLYNLFIFFTIGEKGYLYYVVYLFFTGVATAQIRGHGFEFLWSSQVWFNHYVPILHSGAGIFSTLFLINYLHTKKRSMFFHRIFQGFLAIFILAMVLAISGQKMYASTINQSAIGLSALTIFFASIYIYIRGYKPAGYIVIAWSFYLIGLFIFVLAGAGILPYNTFTSSAFLFGSALEMILLSVALAAKIDFYKKQSALVQKKLYDESEKNRRLVEDQNKILEHRVSERTEELNVVNEELSVNLERLHEQNIVIAKKNQDITASINYAKRIQDAMLPSLNDIQTEIPNSFVYFEPRDIVSGDFYYFSKVEQKLIIAAIDCTGHGVPGAFMSLIGNDLLNEIVESRAITNPALILDELDKGVTKALRQGNTQIRDGMDAAICVIDKESNSIEFAGARNPLIYLKNDNLQILKGDRQSVGGNISNQHKTNFTSHSLQITEPTKFYLFSDGFQDQFGGKNDRKFTVKRFRQTIMEASTKSFAQQEHHFKNILHNWRGFKNRQIDDVLIIGFELAPQ